MVINVSVQYNGGLLPDIIPLMRLTLGNPFNTRRVFVPTANVQCFHLNLLTIFPPRVDAQNHNVLS